MEAGASLETYCVVSGLSQLWESQMAQINFDFIYRLWVEEYFFVLLTFLIPCNTLHFSFIVALILLILLIKCYNLYKVLACSTTFFQLSLFCATFFQLCTFTSFVSTKMSSSQRVLGLPVGLLDMGFHLLILCTILSSAMHLAWPNQFSLCLLINPIIFCPFSISLISWLVLFLQ